MILMGKYYRVPDTKRVSLYCFFFLVFAFCWIVAICFSFFPLMFSIRHEAKKEDISGTVTFGSVETVTLMSLFFLPLLSLFL